MTTSRAVAVVLGLVALASVWLAITYGGWSDWQADIGSESGGTFAGFLGSFTAIRVVTVGALLVLLLVAVALWRERRLIAGGAAAVLAVVVAAAFLVSPVPLTDAAASAVVLDLLEPELDPGFLTATALAGGAALLSLLLAVAAWRMQPEGD